jgi:predicted AlkP superfamily phosphohydrolase/phosphomutase
MLTAEQMLAQRNELIELTRKVADLGEMLITENPWDLFLICFGATHRAGHKLWDRTSITPTPQQEQCSELEHALRDVYVACDEAIGRLGSKVDANTTVIVFSLHGMGPNNSRLNVLPEMLDRVLAGHGSNTSKDWRPERKVLAQQIRRLMPEEWRERVKRRLPLRIQDQLTAFWRFGNRDWSGTRAFPLVGDLHGYVRVNLAGRESRGVVSPGQEYDDLCKELIAGLTTFVDADSGEAVVEDVVRTDNYFPDGRRREFLPDLVVRWSETPSARHRLIRSAQFGDIEWPAPGRNPDGRSGNHRHEGMVFIRHPGLQAGGSLGHACIHDLVPTVYRLLDVPVPAALPGKSLL